MASRAKPTAPPRPTGSRSARPTSCTSAARSRGPSRAARTSSAPPTARRSRTRVAPRARTCATPSVPRARPFPGWADRTAMNRGQVLYRVAELMEGRREQFADEVAPGRGRDRAAGARDRRPGDRPLGLVRRLGRQDRPGPRLVEPGRGGLLQLHDPRADGRRRASWRPRRPRCSGSCRGWRRRSCRQHRRGPRLGDAAAARDHPDRGPRDVRRARRASSTS